MPLQTPTVGIQIPELAPGASGLGSEAISLVQQNQRSASDVAAEQDLLTSQIPTAQAARKEQLADLVSKAQVRRNTRALFPENATEFQLNLAQRYQEVTGRMPPVNAQTGQVDFGAMNQEMARIADQQLDLQRQRISGTRGRNPGAATAAQVATAQDAIADAEEQLGKLSRVRSIVDSGVNAVGPLRGSKVGALAAQGQAVAGSEEVYNNQRELEMWTNEQVISRSEKMKGQLSDKDIRFLVQSVPKLLDTEDVWRRFFDTYEKALKTAQKNSRLRASGQLIGEPPSEIAPDDFNPASSATAAPGAAPDLRDDQLARGTFVEVPETGAVVFEVDGITVPGTPDLIQRVSAIQEQSTDTLESMVGRVPIFPAAGGLQQPGQITPLYDRAAFGAARVGALTGGLNQR